MQTGVSVHDAGTYMEHDTQSKGQNYADNSQFLCGGSYLIMTLQQKRSKNQYCKPDDGGDQGNDAAVSDEID